eukprot:2043766-Rhodomonas_salina.3
MMMMGSGRRTSWEAVSWSRTTTEHAARPSGSARSWSSTWGCAKATSARPWRRSRSVLARSEG